MHELTLVPRGVFNADAALAVLAAHCIPGAEAVDLGRHRFTRLIDVDGTPTRVDLRLGADRVGVTVHPSSVVGTGPAAHGVRNVDGLVVTLRRWLDLDADVAAIETTLRTDPALGPIVARHPGVRLVGYPAGFEAAVATVVGQQVSLAAARTFLGRIVSAFGTHTSGLQTFPSPTTLAALTPGEVQSAVGLTVGRSRTVHELARLWALGFDLSGVTVEEMRHTLLGVPRIGPWSVDYLAIRALQHPDTFAAGDLVARRALTTVHRRADGAMEGAGNGAVSIGEARSLAAVWSPWRSYAQMCLWFDAAYRPLLPW